MKPTFFRSANVAELCNIYSTLSGRVRMTVAKHRMQGMVAGESTVATGKHSKQSGRPAGLNLKRKHPSDGGRRKDAEKKRLKVKSTARRKEHR